MISAHANIAKSTGTWSSAPKLAFGLFILWGFGYSTAWQYLTTDVVGTIVASVDTPYPHAARYSSVYVVRQADDTTMTYDAGATDHSLPRGLPVGTVIEKHKWSFDTVIGGKRSSFPIIFYDVVLAFGLVALIAGLIEPVRAAWRRLTETNKRPSS